VSALNKNRYTIAHCIAISNPISITLLSFPFLSSPYLPALPTQTQKLESPSPHTTLLLRANHKPSTNLTNSNPPTSSLSTKARTLPPAPRPRRHCNSTDRFRPDWDASTVAYCAPSRVKLENDLVLGRDCRRSLVFSPGSLAT
jgi:hypothetical protein